MAKAFYVSFCPSRRRLQKGRFQVKIVKSCYLTGSGGTSPSGPLAGTAVMFHDAVFGFRQHATNSRRSSAPLEKSACVGIGPIEGSIAVGRLGVFNNVWFW